jgi:VanZ family protein
MVKMAFWRAERQDGRVIGLGPSLALIGVVVALILYGSFYPFHLQPLPPGASLPELLAERLANTPSGGRGDITGNLLLFLPFGGALALALGGRCPRAFVMLLATLLAAILALGIETTQLFIPGRVTSAWDVACNLLGSGFGAGLALTLGQLAPRVGSGTADPFALLLVLTWLGYRFFPYVPSIDLQGWWHAVKPLLTAASFDPLRGFRLTVEWLTAAEMTAAATDRQLPRRLAVPALLLGTLAGKVVVVDSHLSIEEVVAVALVLPGWALCQQAGLRARAGLLLGLLLAATLMDRLEPFQFGPAQTAFGWIPFRSFLAPSGWGAGIQAGLQKFFLYGGLLWLSLRAGTGLPTAGALLLLLTLGTSMMQVFLPGRSAEITDTVLAAAVTLALVVSRRLEPRPSPSAQTPRS